MAAQEEKKRKAAEQQAAQAAAAAALAGPVAGTSAAQKTRHSSPPAPPPPKEGMVKALYANVGKGRDGGSRGGAASSTSAAASGRGKGTAAGAAGSAPPPPPPASANAAPAAKPPAPAPAPRGAWGSGLVSRGGVKRKADEVDAPADTPATQQPRSEPALSQGPAPSSPAAGADASFPAAHQTTPGGASGQSRSYSSIMEEARSLKHASEAAGKALTLEGARLLLRSTILFFRGGAIMEQCFRKDDSPEALSQRQQAAQIFLQTADLLRFVVSTAERALQAQQQEARAAQGAAAGVAAGAGAQLTILLALRCRAACLAKFLRCKRKTTERDAVLLRQEAATAAQSAGPVPAQQLAPVAKRADALSQVTATAFQLADAWEAVAAAEEAIERSAAELQAGAASTPPGPGGGASPLALIVAEAVGRARLACSAVGANGCAGKAAGIADRLDAAVEEVEAVIAAEKRAAAVAAEGGGAAGGGGGESSKGATPPSS